MSSSAILAPMQSELAGRTSRDSFQELAETYRYQLQVHCYRMLGSLHEAEDLVQETFLRAWRARERFEGRTSFRNWLYRIATNACLNAISSRSHAARIWPDQYGPPADSVPVGEPAREVPWLEPYPEHALSQVVDETPGPDARYEMRESVQLAFVAAIQQLPARQRAVLLLRDVLGWSAAEAADLLDTTPTSINSALQRARATLERQGIAPGSATSDMTSEAERELLDRYVTAWERSDIDGFVALLKEDAVLRMPPWAQWYLGRHAIEVFFRAVGNPRPRGTVRVLPSGANGQPAYGHYVLRQDGLAFDAHNIQVLTLQRGSIGVLTAFRDPALFEKFGLPPSLPR